MMTTSGVPTGEWNPPVAAQGAGAVVDGQFLQLGVCPLEQIDDRRAEPVQAPGDLPDQLGECGIAQAGAHDRF
jgi:hypothetical protein